VNGSAAHTHRTVAAHAQSKPRPQARSSWTYLSAGDIIATGTPGGVGAARTPPLWMAPGDVVKVEITGVGVLSNTVIDESGDSGGHE
jgi:N-methylhydantoinase B/oxoprolinase/acetone carboxylase alpha subunit